MKKILNNYAKLEAERTKLKEVLELTKDNPIKQLESFSETSTLYGNIDNLKDEILLEGRNFFENQSDEDASKFILNFKEIDDFTELLTSQTYLVREGKNNDLALNHLKGLTELQKKKNNLMQDIVNYAQIKIQKKKTKGSI